jgi:hypothetical protein
LVGTRATSGTQYYLHNTTDGTSYTGTGSTSIQTMQFSQNTPSATSLYDYSTNDGQGNFGGRYIQTTTPSFTNTNALQVANWKFQVITNGQTKFSGTTYLDIWAEPSSGLSTDSVNLTAMVGYGASTTTTGNGNGNNGSGGGNTTVTWTNEGSATATGSNCGSWREFIIPVTTTAFSASKNDWIEVLLFNSGTTGVRIAYDTTVYSANVIWTQK